MKYLRYTVLYYEEWTLNNLWFQISQFTMYIWMAFWSGLIPRISCHTLNIWKASLLCGSSHAPSRNLMLKRLVTHCAFELNSSRVDPLMGFQVTWCKEALVTLCALEWLFSHVGSLMFLQVASYWAALVALWSFKNYPVSLIFVLSLGKATLRFLLSPFCDLILPDAECWMAKLQLYGSGNKIK